jgi:hypothetical protein
VHTVLVYSMSSYLLSFKAATGPSSVQERKVIVTSIQEALEAYDREHGFARSVLLPEEDRAKLTAARWEGGYRWFRTPNVVCLEKARKLRAEGRI